MFETKFLGAVVLGLAASSAGFGQATTNGNVPRAVSVAEMKAAGVIK